VLVANTTGASNVAVGSAALDANTTASNSNAFGYNALGANTTGAHNNAFGYGALDANTTAAHNCAFGHDTLGATTTGAQNTAIGNYAAQLVTTGTGNVAIGYTAGDVITDGAYNVTIGQGCDPSGSGGTNQIVIGSLNQTGKGDSTGFIAPSTGAVYQGNNSTAWTATSDRRIKKDIVPNTKGLAAIVQIEPKNFYYKSDEELQEEMPGAGEGLPLDILTTSAIAQELELIFPEAILRRTKHDIMSVNTDPIFWAMVNAIKELSAKVTELEGKLNG
jgi:hypothetical protein